MIRLNFAGKIHRMYVGADGLVHWGAYPGGSGNIVASVGGLGDLGHPDVAATLTDLAASGEPMLGHLGQPQVEGVAATLTVTGGLAVCPEIWTDGNRLSVEALWSDGQVRQRVMSADTYHPLSGWDVIDTEPAEMTPSGAPPVTDVHIEEVSLKAVAKACGG